MTEDITRRQFLNLGRRNESARVSTIIEQKIQDELNLTPQDVHIDFAFGNHVVDDDILRDIKEKGANVVIGEIDRSYVEDFTLKPQPVTSSGINGIDREESSLHRVSQRVLNPGAGASIEEFVFARAALNELIQSGVTLGATDSSIWREPPSYFIGTSDEDFYNIFSPPPIERSLKRIGKVALLMSALPLYSLARAYVSRFSPGGRGSRSNMTRRSFLYGSAIGASILGVHSANQYLHAIGVDALEMKVKPRDSVLYEGQEVGRFHDHNLAQERYEARREEILNNEHPIGTYTEVVLNLRTKFMALNSWVSLARYGKSTDGQPTKLYFFAGSGHDDAVGEFLKGVDQLESEVEEFAHKICTDSLDKLLDVEEGVEKNESLRKDIESAKGTKRYLDDVVDMFDCPYFVGRNVPLESSDGLKRIPRSPNTIMIDMLQTTLEQELELGKTNPRAQKKAKILLQLLQRMAFIKYDQKNEVSQCNYEEAPPILSEEANIPEAELSAIRSSLFTVWEADLKNGIESVTNDSAKIITIDYGNRRKDRILVGMAKYNNQYYPVERSMGVATDESSLEMKDLLILPRNRTIQIGSQQYKRVSSSVVDNPAEKALIVLGRATFSGASPHFYLRSVGAEADLDLALSIDSEAPKSVEEGEGAGKEGDAAGKEGEDAAHPKEENRLLFVNLDDKNDPLRVDMAFWIKEGYA